MDILTLSGMLGHADVGTTQTFYLHPRLEAMHRQMDCITPACGWFRAAPPSRPPYERFSPQVACGEFCSAGIQFYHFSQKDRIDY